MSKKNIMRFALDAKNPPKAGKKALARLDAMTDEDIDYSDIPELDETFWAGVRPRRKKMVALRLDEEILEWFRGRGKGYQTHINAVLKHYMDAMRH